MRRERTIVGVAERVDLPDWGVRLRAKIDTGAKTSALHAEDVEELPGGQVRFSIVMGRRTRTKKVQVVAAVARRTRVRSSTGQAEERLIVRTTLVLGGVSKDIEVSLSRRREMIFRMLLGREALAHDFLVDPGRRYLHGRMTKSTKKKAPRRTGDKATSRTRRAPTPRLRGEKKASKKRAATRAKPKPALSTRKRSSSS